MAERLIALLGDLNSNYGYSSSTQGFAVGYYDTLRPNMLYDSSTGKLSFKIYNQDYMSFEYNAGSPRVWLGNSVNSVELVASGLNVGTTGRICGGAGLYKQGSGFWMGYHDSKYKFSIGNFSTGQYLDWDGTDLTVAGNVSVTSLTVGVTGFVKGGMSDYNVGAGFWMGYSGGAYKLSIGNSAGKKLLWDGTNLNWNTGETAIETDGILRAKSAIISGTLTAEAGTIGGFTLNASSLYNSTNIMINAASAAYYIKSATYGNNGVQIEYNGGTPRLYVGNGSSKYLKFDGTDLTYSTSKTTIENDGVLRANDAIISGTITANTGKIGGVNGWTIAAGKITSTGIGVATSTGDGTYAFWAGDDTSSAAEFSVTHAGALKSTSGQIGGWTITGSTLQSGNIQIDAGNNKIVCNDIIIDGNRDCIKSINYVAGPNGSGFLLDPNLLEVGNISARGIIKTAVFQKDTISSVGGTVAILDADVIFTDMTASDSSTMTISGTSVFTANDFLRIKDGTNDEWLQVSSRVGSTNTYNVQRDKNLDYTFNNNPAWTKGNTVVNYGSSSEGGLLLTSSLTNSPYLSVFTNGTTPWDGTTERLRIGNLNGYLGYSTDTYGFGLGSIGAYEPNLTFDPSYGIRIRSGINAVFTADYAGNIIISGTEVGLRGVAPFMSFVSSSAAEASAIAFYGISRGYDAIAQINALKNNFNISTVVPISLSASSQTVSLDTGGQGLRLEKTTDGAAVFYNLESLIISGTNNIGTIKVKRTSSLDTYTIPNVGNASFVMDTGVSTLASVRTFSSGIKIGSTALESWIDTGSHGSGSTVCYLGSNTIDTSVPSDKRLKIDIKPTKYGLKEINKLNVIDFKFKNLIDKVERTGLIAQEVEPIFINAVKKRSDGYLEVQYKEFIPIIIKAIQELSEEIRKIKNEI